MSREAERFKRWQFQPVMVSGTLHAMNDGSFRAEGWLFDSRKGDVWQARELWAMMMQADELREMRGPPDFTGFGDETPA